MKRPFIFLLLLLGGCSFVQAQQRHKPKHELHPGLSFAYLPTWILDDYHGNIKAHTFMSGINGHQEFGKESVFIFGVTYAKFNTEEQEEEIGIIVPLRLQKFFNPDRKGFNLAFGFLMSYCTTCYNAVSGAYSNEISYLFFGHSLDVNVGLQTMLGGIFDPPEIYFGPQVQVTWHPRDKEKR